MPIRTVQSALNSKVKELRSALRQRRTTPSGLVGLEGIHLLEEALLSGIELRTIFVAQGQEHLLSEPPLAAFQLPKSVDILAIPREALNLAATTETPQPIAALPVPRAWSCPDRFVQSSPLLVVLAGIQDPGNLGAILRSAEAFGASGAILLPGTVSPWNPKAMRGSAGSVFRLPLIASSEAECFQSLASSNIQTLAAMPHEAQSVLALDLTQPVAFVIGSEGSGLSPETAARCSARVTIPCPGPVESLNAAVATSILLYEAARQRQPLRAAER